MKNDPITPEMEASTNIAWFACDRAGRIGSFESCGFAWIHPRVLESDSERRELIRYFESVKPCSDVAVHREAFATLQIEDDLEAYCDSAAFFARRGVYVYEVPFSPQREDPFMLLVEPIEPLNLESLPVPERSLLSQIRLDLDFGVPRFKISD
jgi:hypothetical protein